MGQPKNGSQRTSHPLHIFSHGIVFPTSLWCGLQIVVLSFHGSDDITASIPTAHQLSVATAQSWCRPIKRAAGYKRAELGKEEKRTKRRQVECRGKAGPKGVPKAGPKGEEEAQRRNKDWRMWQKDKEEVSKIQRSERGTRKETISSDGEKNRKLPTLGEDLELREKLPLKGDSRQRLQNLRAFHEKVAHLATATKGEGRSRG